MRKVVNLLLVVVLVVTAWLGFSSQSRALPKNMHRSVVDVVLDGDLNLTPDDMITEINQYTRDWPILLFCGLPPAHQYSGDLDVVTAGAIDEDYLSVNRLWCEETMTLHHSWNPNTNDGWNNIPTADTALDWAASYFDEALERYAAGNKESAHYLLGRAVHLLEDMVTPAHVHGDAHIPPNTDSYEVYLGESDRDIDEFRPDTGWGPQLDYQALRDFDTLDEQDFLPEGFKDHFIQNVNSHYGGGQSAREVWESGIEIRKKWPLTLEKIRVDPDLFRIFYYTAELADDFDSNGFLFPAIGEIDGGTRDLTDTDRLREIGSKLIPEGVKSVSALTNLFWERTNFPEIRIPTQDDPALVGSPLHPKPMRVVVSIWSQLTADDFSVQIGGETAEVLHAVQSDGEYRLWVSPPSSLASNTAYDLTVTVGSETDTETYAVQYGQDRFSVAEHYAPVWYQDTHEARPTADYITRFDYDDDWVGNNNWDNLGSGSFKAYIYYSIIETESHWFVVYADFHPQDWEEGLGCLVPGACHENDMEGALLAIRKDETEFGSLEFMLTQRHGSFADYRKHEIPIEPGTDQPMLYVEEKGHGVCAWDDTGIIFCNHPVGEFNDNDGVVYKYRGTPGIPSSRNDRDVSYALRPIDELWLRRYCSGNGRTFDRLDLAGFTLGDRFDSSDVGGDSARPPWGWDDGQPFWDPAAFFRAEFGTDVGDDFSDVYIFNPYWRYITSDRRLDGTPIEKGLCYLSLSQHRDGHWSGNTAITSMDVLAYLNAGYPESDPDVSAAMQYILANQTANGSIHNDPNRATYHTGLALLPLKATRNDNYNDNISMARDWLVGSQWDDSSWWSPVNESHSYWGGFGYGNHSRPDLSNTQFALLGLDAADLPDPDANNTWDKAETFVSRCQRSDGGFGYVPYYSVSWGSMTGAGIWGLALAGQTPEDAQFANALNWVESHYTWDSNPNRGSTALYYYYLSMSKALSMARKNTVAGRDWFSDLENKLSAVQRSDGSWYNSNSSLWENNRDLATAYALLSLQTRTLPEEADLEMVIILHSPADLHLFGPLGRHTGKNYESGGTDLFILGSTYFEEHPQTIRVSQPLAGNYTVQLIGTDGGAYQLEIIGFQGEEIISYESYEGTIDPGEAQGSFLNVGAIEGALTIFSSAPETLPVMNVQPGSLTLTGAPDDVLHSAFILVETGGDQDIHGISVFASDLTDGAGHTISASSISLAPTNFDLPAGASQPIDVTIPLGTDLPDGTYAGSITVESINAGAKNVQVAIEVISNIPPIADAGDSYPAFEGQPVTLDASGSTDTDGEIVLYEWDLDNDGEYDDATGVTVDTIFYENDTYPVGLRVTDDYGDTGTDTAEVVVANVDPSVNVDPVMQGVQYSDYIADVSITATDVADDALQVVATTWNVGGGAFMPGLPNDLMLTDGGCSITDHTNTCNWTLSGIANVSAGVYTVRTTVDDDDGGQTDVDITLTVHPEDASVAFEDENPVAVKVAEPGGNSGPFDLTMYVSETQPDQPVDSSAAGDISLANVSMSLAPVGPGSPVAGDCTPGAVMGSDYDALLPVTCSFDGVEVNAYSAQVTVDGGYYAGYGEDVLVVYDPSLGFATGGGWFYWPETGERTNFGFTMKYNKKGQRVKGNFLLIRHMPDGSIYRVKSNALYGLALGEDPSVPSGWASFSGKSTYLEPGWPDPVGNHEFMVYVEDRDEPGTGVDRFWIEMKDKDREIIPDLSMARDATDNAVQLQGGNVAVPHGVSKK